MPIERSTRLTTGVGPKKPLFGGWLKLATLLFMRNIRVSPRAWLMVLLAVCVVSFWLRSEKIEGSLPYPIHIDERYITEPAARVLTTGDFHPGGFQYPALPIYFAAASMAVGFIRSAADLQIRYVKEIRSVVYPYYTVPIVVETARQFFALLSVVTLAATGAAAFHLFGRLSSVALAPLVLTLSPFFFQMSWRYLNVDIVGACFVALGIASILKGTKTPTLRWLAVTPAICAGLAAGSKYTYSLLLLTVLIGISLFAARGRRLEASAIAIATAAVTFLAVTPYTLIDLTGFLNGLAWGAYHYASGHLGYEGPRGVAKLAYYGGWLLKDFGVGALLVALIGLVWAIRADWRRTVVLLSFPVVLLALLALQRVHFARNILPIFSIVTILIVAGIYSIHGLLVGKLVRTWASPRIFQPLGALIFLVLSVVALYQPLGKFPGQFRAPPESRLMVVEWIEEHLPSNWTIIVPEELGLDVRPLEARGYSIRTEKFMLLKTGEAIGALIKSEHGPVVLLVPEWGADRRFPSADRAATLNHAVAETPLRLLNSFEGRRLSVNYPQPIALGNPAISIAVPDT